MGQITSDKDWESKTTDGSKDSFDVESQELDWSDSDSDSNSDSDSDSDVILDAAIDTNEEKYIEEQGSFIIFTFTRLFFANHFVRDRCMVVVEAVGGFE